MRRLSTKSSPGGSAARLKHVHAYTPGTFLVPWKDITQNVIKVNEETKVAIQCFAMECQEEAVETNCVSAMRMVFFARVF